MISLQPMSDDDFHAYLEYAIVEYAQDRIAAGNWQAAEALELSRQKYQEFLPQGNHTAANYLFSLLNEAGQKVGYLWYKIDVEQPDSAFIYDFEINKQFRRQGYATQALTALEEHAKSLGVKKLGLHVFGHNAAARELYRKVGYIETNINMAKEI